MSHPRGIQRIRCAEHHCKQDDERDADDISHNRDYVAEIGYDAFRLSCKFATEITSIDWAFFFLKLRHFLFFVVGNICSSSVAFSKNVRYY